MPGGANGLRETVNRSTRSAIGVLGSSHAATARDACSQVRADGYETVTQARRNAGQTVA
jgi:hypothetical protein